MLWNRKSIILPILYMVFLFSISSVSIKTGNLLEAKNLISRIIQNLLHVPAYGLSAFLWMKAFNKSKLSFKKALVFAAVITLFSSAFTELHQQFVPGRYATFGDFLLNAIGCASGLFVFWRFCHCERITSPSLRAKQSNLKVFSL